MNSQPIGLFDSGVGGVSIWQAIQQLMPNEHTIYLADNKNAPYGHKTKDEIVALSEKNTEFLLAHNAKLIVVACNTASTNAIPHLRQKYKVPFIRIQPAIKPASLQSKTKKIGLLATQSTLNSDMLQELKQLEPIKGVEIFGQYGKGLVEIVENNQMESDETYRLLEEHLRPLIHQNIDQLVLGCTHYPFLIPQIQKVLGTQINIIEPSMAIAKQTKRILSEFDLLASQTQKARHLFYANGETDTLKKLLPDLTNIIVAHKDF